jgi:hypothetical protein
MTKHHYVYHSYEEWGREYIGVRSSDCLPEEDTKYFGTFSDKTFKPTGKVILFVCETRQEASEIEIKLHDFFDVAVNPQFANKAKATSTKFDTTGLPNTEEAKKKISESLSGEKNPMFGMSGEKHPNYGRTGALCFNSKAVTAIQPDGTELHFGGGREAARELGINPGNLSTYSKTGQVLKWGKWKGWQFFYKNSENFPG